MRSVGTKTNVSSAAFAIISQPFISPLAPREAAVPSVRVVNAKVLANFCLRWTGRSGRVQQCSARFQIRGEEGQATAEKNGPQPPRGERLEKPAGISKRAKHKARAHRRAQYAPASFLLPPPSRSVPLRSSGEEETQSRGRSYLDEP